MKSSIIDPMRKMEENMVIRCGGSDYSIHGNSFSK